MISWGLSRWGRRFEGEGGRGAYAGRGLAGEGGGDLNGQRSLGPEDRRGAIRDASADPPGDMQRGSSVKPSSRRKEASRGAEGSSLEPPAEEEQEIARRRAARTGGKRTGDC